jgi:hypothetical protein
MANTVISNNGNEAQAAILDVAGNVIQEAVQADPQIRITNVDTQEVKILPPNSSIGLAHGAYLVEVI